VNTGQVFRGINILTNEKVVVKTENYSSEIKLLKNESMIYYYLKNCKGVLPIKWFGSYSNCLYLVLPYKTYCLTEIIENKNKDNDDTLILTIISSIISQLVEIISEIHEKGILHRDLKPDNILLDDQFRVFVIDFGFSKKFIVQDNHIKNNNKKRSASNIIGTPNYVSINIHEGNEPSRRDDMEAIGYIWLHFILGKLPWDNNIDSSNILKIKKDFLDMKHNSGYIRQIQDFLYKSHNMIFDEKPDYQFFLTSINKSRLAE
jgi:serine/threonine protein kinase